MHVLTKSTKFNSLVHKLLMEYLYERKILNVKKYNMKHWRNLWTNGISIWNHLWCFMTRSESPFLWLSFQLSLLRLILVVNRNPVEILVDSIEIRCGSTVDIEPPITNSSYLVKNCAIWTEETELLSTW